MKRAERGETVVTAASFGDRLRWWRERRGLSQLDLAAAAESTQRHVSFLESGRSAPSREMILRLAAVLDLPLRQQNALFLAAGYAPAWRESALSAPELARVNGALDHMLAQQEPYPAFVVDRRWTLLRANAGAARLTEFLTGPPAPDAAPPGEPANLALALVSPEGLRPFIVNWEEVVRHFVRGVPTAHRRPRRYCSACSPCRARRRSRERCRPTIPTRRCSSSTSGGARPRCACSRRWRPSARRRT
jgi:transcriptional regulator with XRE-family HTH domain